MLIFSVMSGFDCNCRQETFNAYQFESVTYTSIRVTGNSIFQPDRHVGGGGGMYHVTNTKCVHKIFELSIGFSLEFLVTLLYVTIKKKLAYICQNI